MIEMNDAQALRGLSDLLQELSDATGLSKSAVQSEVAKLDYVTYEFNGVHLVSPADFIGIIDSWAAQLKSDIHRSYSVAVKPTKTKKVAPKKSPAKATKKVAAAKTASKVVKKAPAKSTKKVTPKKSTAKATKKTQPKQLEIKAAKPIIKKSTKKATKKTPAVASEKSTTQKQPVRRTRKRTSTRAQSSPKAIDKKAAASKAEEKVSVSEMELPKGYRKRVSNRYGPTLQSVLPDDSALKQAYLNEIVMESNLGKSFLERVADSIKIKYRGKITSHTAYQGLLAKAQAM